MNIDFALVLVILTGITGLVCLLDVCFLAPKRRQLARAHRQKAGVTAEDPNVLNLLRPPLWIEYPRSFFPVLLIVLVLRSFLFEPFKIPSGSMKPTLIEGDFILVNKFNYGLRLPVIGTMIYPLGLPQRGDVLVFKYPEDPGINYIKRVVGLPGDTVRYVDKRLQVNGQWIPQTLAAQLPPEQPMIEVFNEQLGAVNHQIWNTLGQGQRAGEWQVPVGHYFVMGDNRDNSRDSRAWGFVPDKLIVGRAFAVWMHVSNWVPTFSRDKWIH
jgi:signal peptidase I